MQHSQIQSDEQVDVAVYFNNKDQEKKKKKKMCIRVYACM